LSVFEGIDGNGGRVQVGESLEAVADSRIHGSPSWGVCIRFMLNVMYHVIANELFVLKVFRRRASVETMVMNEPNRTDQFGVGRCLALAGMHTFGRLSMPPKTPPQSTDSRIWVSVMITCLLTLLGS